MDKKVILSTLFHTLEFTLVLLVAYTFTKLFNLPNEIMRDVISIVFAAFVKFARASEKVPVSDYVNNIKDNS